MRVLNSMTPGSPHEGGGERQCRQSIQKRISRRWAVALGCRQPAGGQSTGLVTAAIPSLNVTRNACLILSASVLHLKIEAPGVGRDLWVSFHVASKPLKLYVSLGGFRFLLERCPASS